MTEPMFNSDFPQLQAAAERVSVFALLIGGLVCLCVCVAFVPVCLYLARQR